MLITNCKVELVKAVIESKRAIGIEDVIAYHAQQAIEERKGKKKVRPDPKQHISTNYVVCPKSGLSYTVADDWNASWFTNQVHPVANDPDRLFAILRTHGSELPKSYLCAGILLKLDESELIEWPDKEPKYCRGQIVEHLCQHYDSHQLLALYWKCFNSKAAIKRQPIRLNLTSLLANLNSVFFQINSIASQELSIVDLPPSLSVSDVNRKIKTDNAGLLSKYNSRVKLDPKSARARVKEGTVRLANKLYELDETSLSAPLASYKVAMRLIDDYMHHSETKRARLIELYEDLHTAALGYMAIPRDGTFDKSLQITIELMKANVAPASDDILF